MGEQYRPVVINPWNMGQPGTFCLDLRADKRVAMVARASEESSGGAISTTPEQRPTTSTNSCTRRKCYYLLLTRQHSVINLMPFLWQIWSCRGMGMQT